MSPAETLDDRCASPSINEALTSYCFGDLDASGREQVSFHLLECDICWEEFQRLDECVRALRHDPHLNLGAPTLEMFSVLGMSGRLDQPFAGHTSFVLVVAGLYGLLHVASVWTELGYSYGQFGALAWVLSPLVFLWTAGTLASALHLDAKQAFKGTPSGLGWSSAISLVGVATLVIVSWILLPASPTIQASFQTRSAAGGFLKNELLYFVPLLVFVLPTFHAVVQLQRELRAGRTKPMLDFLAGRPEGISPRGVWFVPSWLLIAVLLVAVFVGYTGIHKMLDHLTPGPYANLFTTALHVRVVLWYVVALVCLAWYQRSLQELKREAVAAGRLLGDIR